MPIVYALCDPDSSFVRYVGITRQKPHDRLRDHIKTARNGGVVPVCIWIRGLLADGKRPVLHILECGADWVREVEWIAHYRSIHDDLLNVSGGGQGGNLPQRVRDIIAEKNRGRPLSEEHRLKLSISHKGFQPTAETRAKLSAANKGRKHSDETKAKMRRPKTPEHREAAAEAVRRGRAEGRWRVLCGDDNPTRKNPQSVKRGADNGQSKLTVEMITEMRRLSDQGISTVQLAKRFGISQCTAWRIVRNLAWTHVPWPTQSQHPDTPVPPASITDKP